MQNESSTQHIELTGKRVVLTGTFPVTYLQLKKALVKEGALVYGAVTESTSTLVAGQSPQAVKMQLAKRYDLAVFSGDDVIGHLRQKGHQLDDTEDHSLASSEMRDKVVSTLRDSLENALANTLASVMIQLGVTSLRIEHVVREGVENGNYQITSRTTPDSTEFILTDMDSERRHDLWKDGDLFIPPSITDRNGDVVLDLCKKCGRGEQELLDHPACTPRNKAARYA